MGLFRRLVQSSRQHVNLMAWTRIEAVVFWLYFEGKPLRFVERLNVRYEIKREIKNDS